MIYKGKINITLNGYEINRAKREQGVYSIIHGKTNKIYHGSTYNLYNRITEHVRDLANLKHVNSDLQDIAIDDGTFSLIFHQTDSIDDAIRLEQEYIDNTDKDLLLNISMNSSLGFDPVSFKMKKRLSLAKIGNLNSLNKKHTEDQIEEKSIKMIGNSYRRGIKHTKEIKEYLSHFHKMKKFFKYKINNPHGYKLASNDELTNNKKLCSGNNGCGLLKQLSEFRKITKRSSFYSVCRECERRIKREYRRNLSETPYIDKELYRKMQTDRLSKVFNIKITGNHIKKCAYRKCDKIKNIDDFSLHAMSPDGHSSICNACLANSYKNRLKYKPGTIEEKQCTGDCNDILHISNFRINKLSKDGYNNICIKCEKNRRDNYILTGRQEFFLKEKSNRLKRKFNIISEYLVKMCSKCDHPKPITDFNKNSSSSDGYSSLCKTHLSRNQKCVFTVAKITCHSIVKMALNSGLIKRHVICQTCGAQDRELEAHHHDYSEPLNISWLCIKCHSKWHSDYKFIDIICLPDDDIENIARIYNIKYISYFILYSENVMKYVVFVVKDVDVDHMSRV